MTAPVVNDVEFIIHKDSFMPEFKCNMDFYITLEALQDIRAGRSLWAESMLKTIGEDVFEAFEMYRKEHDDDFTEMYNNPRIVE